jgi:hypothetical protein
LQQGKSLEAGGVQADIVVTVEGVLTTITTSVLLLKPANTFLLSDYSSIETSHDFFGQEALRSLGKHTA